MQAEQDRCRHGRRVQTRATGLHRERGRQTELAEIYPESDAERLADRIARDLEHSGEAAE